jgi:hypothetical protein
VVHVLPFVAAGTQLVCVRVRVRVHVKTLTPTSPSSYLILRSLRIIGRAPGIFITKYPTTLYYRLPSYHLILPISHLSLTEPPTRQEKSSKVTNKAVSTSLVLLITMYLTTLYYHLPSYHPIIPKSLLSHKEPPT